MIHKNSCAILLYFVLILLSTSAVAQNNVYKINDRLYQYYQQCRKNRKQPIVLAMADTLFRMSKKMGDVKAQCLALDAKGDYYYFNDDLKNLRIQKEIVSNFAMKTPYQQYVFSQWNRLIAFYINHYMMALALDETRKYQKVAIHINNSYGIGVSYRKLGDIYFMMHYYELALQEYYKAADYFSKHERIDETYSTYLEIANVYSMQKDYKMNERYLKMALKQIEDDDINKGFCYLRLAFNYLDQNDIVNVERYKYLFEEWSKHNTILGSTMSLSQKFYIQYYLYKHQPDKALPIINKLSGIDKYSFLESYYSYQGEHLKAYTALLERNRIESEASDNAQRQALVEYTALFDNERIKNERNLLALQNAKLGLEQLRSREKLIDAARRQNALMLSNTRLELSNKGLALQREKAETQRQRIEKEKQKADAHHQLELYQAGLEQAKSTQLMIVVLTISLIVISISFTAFSISRQRSARRLRREMEEAGKARNEAEIARNQAVKANQIQTQFLQNMSHEVRTPLNAIVGFSDMLADPALAINENDRTEFSKLIHTNTRLLTNLVNDILDISKMDTGLYKLTYENTNVASLCSSTVDSMQYLVPEYVTLSLLPVQKDFIINTDAMRVQQLLSNLLSNACKYTEKGSITLSCERKDNNAVFSVTDTGCGIAPEDAERIFNRFEKLNSYKQGTGLGLNICRHIAKILGGEVKLDTSYTGGSRFLFIHPIYTKEQIKEVTQ